MKICIELVQCRDLRLEFSDPSQSNVEHYTFQTQVTVRVLDLNDGCVKSARSEERRVGKEC